MGVLNFLWRGVPAYFWVAVVYAAVTLGFQFGNAGAGIDAFEQHLASPFARINTLSGAPFLISLNTVFLAIGFVAVWIEVIRSTRLRDRGGNDLMSLLVTVAAIVIFIGVPGFGTTAFAVVPLAGFGDLLLDRLVGQAVARRDFGRID